MSTYGAEAHERESERVRSAIVTLSGGDIGNLSTLVAEAKKDYRNLLVWASEHQL